MKIIFPISTLFLSSCVVSHDEAPLAKLSLPKQRQKIAYLEKKLERAESEEKKAHEEAERIEGLYKEAKLALIKSEVEEMQNALQSPHKRETLSHLESSKLFYEERELLYDLVQSGSSAISYEAQVVLDTILEIITELSDSEEY